MVDCVRTSERGVTDKKCLDGAGWSDVPSPRSLAAVAIPWQVIIPDICALAGKFTESTTGRFHEAGNDFLAANALYACGHW